MTECCDHKYEVEMNKGDITIWVQFRNSPPWHGYVLIHKDGYYAEIDAVYCPFCGKKLNEGKSHAEFITKKPRPVDSRSGERSYKDIRPKEPTDGQIDMAVAISELLKVKLPEKSTEYEYRQFIARYKEEYFKRVLE